MTAVYLLQAAGLLVALAVAFPLAILAVETCAALLARESTEPPLSPVRPRCAVLVPAHNEEESIGPTVRRLAAQLLPADRLIVVADNCSDDTAKAAGAAGATVLERRSTKQRGKGFALDHGVRFLESDPPDVVIFVDADCAVHDRFVGRLAAAAAVAGRPVQSCNLVLPPAAAGLKDRVSWFAFQYKNLVRPLGLDRLGLPCLLSMGVAFPWPVVRDAPLATGNIVEDMQLGLDLAVAGHSAEFCPTARVTSALPSGRSAAVTQRTRWEHGHLRTLLGQVPRLVAASLRQRRADLLGLALELSVPPLSLLFLLWAVAGVGAGLLASFTGDWLPALILAGSGLAALLAVLAAWFRFGRDHLPWTSLLTAPAYALGKLPIYAAFLLRPQRAWVRTARDTPAAR